MKNFYSKLYDALYKAGYRNNDKNCGQVLLKHAIDSLKFSTALDVGCSTGRGVATLTTSGKKAVGIDISKTAAALARKRGRDCYVGNILDIQYDDDSFDMVYCSDCLEHIRPEDVLKAAEELHRVSSKYLVLHIAMKKEKCLLRHEWFRKSGLKPTPLHVSVFPEDYWLDLFKNLGTSVVSSKIADDGKHLNLILDKSCTD